MKYKETFKFILFLCFLLSVYVICFFTYPTIKKLLTFENIRQYVSNNSFLSVILFILLQILQVVLFAIPGDIINAAGGYIFNIYIGFLLSFIGIILGSIIAFYIARFLGYRFVQKFIPNKKIQKITHLLESSKGFIGFFIFCNLPFVPKDIIMYAAGLTPLKPKRTIFLYCISRIPGILIWTSMGANLYNQSTLGMVITILVLLLFLTLILMLKKWYDKKKIILVKNENT